MTIQTISTKCQYKPTSSTTSALSPGTSLREMIPTSDINKMMPTVTWIPWKPVSVKKLTGFHGIHVTVGIILLMSLVGIISRSEVPGDKAEVVELVGLYWHFVDIVWIVIFTLVYLIPA